MRKSMTDEPYQYIQNVCIYRYVAYPCQQIEWFFKFECGVRGRACTCADWYSTYFNVNSFQLFIILLIKYVYIRYFTYNFALNIDAVQQVFQIYMVSTVIWEISTF